MTCAAIIAVKSPAAAKTRLATVLPAITRARLIETMLRQVLAAARDARSIDEILVVSPWPWRLPANVVVVGDPAGGLSRAFEAAATLAASRGHRQVALLPADLATVTAADLDALVLAASRTGAALATDLAETGTNGLCLPLALPIGLRFGPQSGPRHVDALLTAGWFAARVNRPGLALDIDDSRDLNLLRTVSAYRFLEHQQGSAA